MGTPGFLDDEAFKCLRAGDLEGYDREIKGRDVVDFTGADLRGTDFRRADLSKIVLSGCYLRDADLRGRDLRHLDMDGCSFFHARISGTWFPENLSAEELRLSFDFGVRVRTRK